VTRRLGAVGLALLVTGVLVAATLGAAVAWRARVQDDERRAFMAEAAQVDRRLAASLERIDAGLVAVGAATADGPSLTADVFAGPVLGAVPEELPTAVVTVAVVEPVATDDLEDLAADRREDGLVDFQVRSPADSADEHLVVTFEQSGGAQPLFGGLDLAGIDEAQMTLDEARDGGQPVSGGVLGSLPSDQESLLRSGFLVAEPVYGDGEVPPEGPDRVEDLDRWVVALVEGEALLDAALEGGGAGLEVELHDAEGVLLATTALEGDQTLQLGGVDDDSVTTTTIDRAGGDLTATVARIASVGDDRAATEPTVILLAGGLASVLLGALVWALARTRAGALALAESATSTLQRSEEQFRTVVQNLSDIVLLLDEAGTLRYASPSVRALLDWSPTEVLGSSIFDGMHPDDEGMVREAMVDAGLRRPGRPAGTRRLVELRMRHTDGRFRAFEATISDTAGATEAGGLVFTAHDVSHRIATEERLAHDATHDPLTRLPNRTLLDDRLSHALDRSTRTGAQVAVLFLDLDGFKEVNDGWGHAAGDRVLTEVAGRVLATARASDTVARIGGDEFVVVCEETGSEEGARTLAGRILEVVRQPIVVSGVPHEVGASVGIAVAQPDERDSAGLLRRADEAMYRAKQAGRGRIEVDGSPPNGGSAPGRPESPAT